MFANIDPHKIVRMSKTMQICEMYLKKMSSESFLFTKGESLCKGECLFTEQYKSLPNKSIKWFHKHRACLTRCKHLENGLDNIKRQWICNCLFKFKMNVFFCLSGHGEKSKSPMYQRENPHHTTSCIWNLTKITNSFLL